MISKLNTHDPKEISKEIYKSTIRARLLDKGIDSYLGNKRNIASEEMGELLKELKQLYNKRLDDADKHKKTVFEVRTKIRKFQEMVRNVETTDEFVNRVKEVMEEIEAFLTENKFNQKDSYEVLLKSEVSLWEECVCAERRIKSWEVGFDQEIQSPSSAVMTVNNNGPNREFLAVQKYLDETGGTTGGWTAIDHATFLRIRQKHTGIKKQTDKLTFPRDETVFFQDLLGLLAPKTLRDIESHEIWYQKYQELLLEKKKAISEWKEIKKKTVPNEEETPVEPESDTSRSNWKEQKKILEEKRKKVDEWRAEKALKDYEMKVEIDKRNMQELEIKRKEEEKKKKEKKEKIGFYKREKAKEEALKLEEQLKLSELEKEEKRRHKELNSARISERNAKFIESQIMRQYMKTWDEEAKRERLNQLAKKVSVSAHRDPNRLLRPTEGWIQKIVSEKGDDKVPVSARITTIQHKAVPTWRQNLT